MLEVRNIVKRFGGRIVLDAVSLNVPAGCAFAVVGPSGCGKTTLLRLIAGLERIDSGAVFIGGREVSSASAHVPPEGRQIGMVFQDLALWPHMCALKHLEFVLRGRGFAKTERVRRAGEALRLVQLEPFANAYPAALSGGEQQRLAIARALVTEPPLLLLDEPVAHLNDDLRNLVFQAVVERMRNNGTAVVMATHQPSDAASIGAKECFLPRHS